MRSNISVPFVYLISSVRALAQKSIFQHQRVRGSERESELFHPMYVVIVYVYLAVCESSSTCAELCVERCMRAVLCVVFFLAFFVTYFCLVAKVKIPTTKKNNFVDSLLFFHCEKIC